jgi:hypothetical protein
MSALVGLEKSPTRWEPQLPEAIWQAWLLKGRVQATRRGAARVKAMKCVSTGALLAAAGLWPYLTSYDVLVRFVVALSAMAVMFEAFHTRRYAFAAVFGALILLYNRVAPVFTFSGGWQHLVLFASVIPFVASLAWSNVKLAHND